jgi:hypothetical protein
MTEYAELLAKNKELKDWLMEDCVCAYMREDMSDWPMSEVVTDKMIQLVKEDNELVKCLLKDSCSCKGE